MRETALVIMAAGIGSRFGGGIKQLEPVGPNGEIIMDYSIHDALAAGFLAAASLSPLCEIIFGGVRIFLLKRRMRRENSFREGNNDAVH